jgi:Na+-driven multidrug efflux pump
MGSRLLKFLALVHFFDATQGTGSGIINSIGDQLYSSIFLFIGFYCIGTPIGVSLLLKTPLQVFGKYL